MVALPFDIQEKAVTNCVGPLKTVASNSSLDKKKNKVLSDNLSML